MPGTLAPFMPPQFFTLAGAPAAGYKLFTYTAGTTTKTTTWSNEAQSAANTNPIVLDSAGMCTPFLQPGLAYKFVLAPPTDTDPPTSPIWTRDNIQAVPLPNLSVDVIGTAGENLLTNDSVILSDGGGGLTAGRWYRADTDFGYKSVAAISQGLAVSDIASGTQGNIRIVGRVTGAYGGGLTPGQLYYMSSAAGGLSSIPTLNARAMAVADTPSTLISAPWMMPNPTLLNLNITAVGNVGVGEDDLMTYSLPEYMMTFSHRSVLVRAAFSVANNANAKTIRPYWNGVSLGSAVLRTGTADPVVAEIRVVRSGANAQKVFGYVSHANGSGASNYQLNFYATGAATESGVIGIKFTGEGVANNDIQQETMSVESVP